MFADFQTSALVVEKKNPLSIFVRYEEESDVVAPTVPLAFVARSAPARLVIAKFVVVAFVVVEFEASRLTKREVDDAKMPLFAQRGEVVAAESTA